VRRLKTALLVGLGVFAAGLAYLYAAYRSDLSAARARIASGSEVAETGCGPIEYAARGQGPAILLVHGAGGGFDQMLDAAGELAARGFRVIVPSRFGYLRTPQRPEATPAAQADAHACLLDTLKIARAALVGVSAGAPSSMQFAIRHPQRTTALVLLVPLAYAPQAPERFAAPAASGRWRFERAGDWGFV
jgi:2-hydroxy-6-oxonona-2,4-dienedioate hydrolase